MDDLGHGPVLVEQTDAAGAVRLGLCVGSEEVGGGGLRVQVDEQDALSLPGIDRCQVDGSGGLAHAALVVVDRERTHSGSPLHWHGLSAEMWKMGARTVSSKDLYYVTSIHQNRTLSFCFGVYWYDEHD